MYMLTENSKGVGEEWGARTLEKAELGVDHGGPLPALPAWPWIGSDLYGALSSPVWRASESRPGVVADSNEEVCAAPSTHWQCCWQQPLFLEISQEDLGCFSEISRPWTRLTLVVSSLPRDLKSMRCLCLSVTGRCDWGDRAPPPCCKEACRSMAPRLSQDPCLSCTVITLRQLGQHGLTVMGTAAVKFSMCRLEAKCN